MLKVRKKAEDFFFTAWRELWFHAGFSPRQNLSSLRREGSQCLLSWDEIDKTDEKAQRSARVAVIQHQTQIRRPILWPPKVLPLPLRSAEIAFAQ